MQAFSGCDTEQKDIDITFREFASKWHERVKNESSLNYYVSTGKAIALINEYIGNYKLRDLSPRIIQGCYYKLDRLKRSMCVVTPKPEEIRKAMTVAKIRFTDIETKYGFHTICTALKGKKVKKEFADNLAKMLKTDTENIFDIKQWQQPYCHETIHKVKRTVRAIFSMAKKQRLITDNYATAAYLNFPKKPPTQIDYLDDEQAKTLHKAVTEYPDIRYKTAILTLLLTGIRRGELCGLEWQDVDFVNGTITIARSLTAVAGHGVILKEPKTESSKRTISIPQSLQKQLAEYKLWYDANAANWGDRWIYSNRLFTQENGDRINPGAITFYLNKVCEKASLPHVSVHSLRHTNITLQIMAGVPLVTVSGRAGHARTSTTTDVYSHFLKSSDKSAANIIDEVFK